MTLPGLALRNAFLRNPLRTGLTLAGIAVGVLAFVFLRATLTAWYAANEVTTADRVVVRNAISITQPLPLSYVERVRAVPGVGQVTWARWFGGIYRDRRNFFAKFGIDLRSAAQVYGWRVVAGTLEDALVDRQSCLVGRLLAERYGFSVGSEVPLQGDLYPGDWRFRVAAIIEADDPSVSTSLYFHWQRLNEALPADSRDRIGTITATVTSAADSPRVIQQIDRTFASSESETLTETERAFRLQFLTGSAAILLALEAVSGIILCIIALIVGNTLAMGLRERTGELGALRAIGFTPARVRRLALLEGCLFGLGGGLLGLILSWPMLRAAGQGFARTGFMLGVGLDAKVALLALLASLAVGTLASVVPAWSVARLDVAAALRRQD